MSTHPENTPVNRAPECGPCGETFARAGFGGSALFLAETLHDAALSAGWQRDAAAWTCSVCLARTPGPEPAPPVAGPAPVPGSDPLDQSLAVLADFDARVDGFWADVNHSNSKASLKVHVRLDDGQAIIRELAARKRAAA